MSCYNMVVSRLNSSVSYPEIKAISPMDLHKTFDIYQIAVYGLDVLIAVGFAQNTFASKNITYFPIYLVKKHPNGENADAPSVDQIGVYEIPSTNLSNYVDEDGDIDLLKVDEPLLYTFVTDKYLKPIYMPPDEDSDDDKSGDELPVEDMSENAMVSIPEARRDIFELDESSSAPISLEIEDAAAAKNEREKYHEQSHDIWIKKFMKNSNYNIVDNEGGGDCLFAAIRDAFKTANQHTTVGKLRNKLSDAATEDIYAAYKFQYDMYSQAIKDITAQSIKINAQYASLRKDLSLTINQDEQRIIKARALKLKQDNADLKSDISNAKTLLKEFKYMKTISSLDEFKKFIRLCDFWGDEWAISTLERVLNIKLIILSSENYSAGDFHNVLHCGTVVDPMLSDVGVFIPEFYLLLDHTGNHYKAISYKNKMLLTFSELPYDIKRMIADKCLEHNSGLYSLIPDFVSFKNSMRGGGEITVTSLPSDTFGDSALRNLYDEGTTFVLYDKSHNSPPGKGSGEIIGADDALTYGQLSGISDWRKKLDDTWQQPFSIDNHRWNSVEHYYQGSKFKRRNPDFYLSFSLDSGTDLSKNPYMARGAGGRTGAFEGELLRPKTVEIDPDFYETRHAFERTGAVKAKFSQNADLLRALAETKRAKLTHHVKGRPSVVLDELMVARDELSRPMAPK